MSKWGWRVLWGACILIGACIGVFLNAISKPLKEPERDPIQIQLDTLYTILVGPDSTSILNTVTRIRIKIDSICAIEYQGRC